MYKFTKVIAGLLAGEDVSFDGLGISGDVQRINGLELGLDPFNIKDIEALGNCLVNFETTEVKGRYVLRKPSEPNGKYQAHFLTTRSQKEKFRKIVDAIFPENSDPKINRISLLLPISANSPQQKSSRWTHRHIKSQGSGDRKGLNQLIEDQDLNYATRLFTAFHLLGKIRPSISNKDNRLFFSWIKDFGLNNLFDVYERDNVKEIEECKEQVEQADLAQSFNRKGYFIFLKNRGSSHQNKAISFKADELYKKNDYDSIKLSNLISLKPKKQEESRQKLLESIAYTLSIFNGEIITFDFEFKYDSSDIKINKPLSVGPTLIAPKPLTDMLHDMHDFNARLNSLILCADSKQDRRKSSKRDSLSGDFELRSPYSIPLLLNKANTFKAPIAQEMEESLKKIRAGEDIATATAALKDDHGITVKGSFCENAFPVHPLDFPSPISMT